MSNPPSALEALVRDTLGCGCPDEVFQRIAHTCGAAAAADWPPTRRFDIGGRLLLYLVDRAPHPLDEAALVALMQRGAADRDAGGFNRVRVVVGCEASPADLARWQDRLGGLFPGDEKLHLHLLPSAAIPALQAR